MKIERVLLLEDRHVNENRISTPAGEFMYVHKTRTDTPAGE